ncbi:MAG TPA: sensor histidine kinase [Mycobacterium sp.]|nr:sensor histidine kinase [Mycobacterium sp.]
MRRWLGIVLAAAGAIPCIAVWRYGNSPPEWAVLPWLYLACGLLAWYRQPRNLTGRLLIATGLAFFVDVLQFNPDPGLWTLGLALELAYIPMFGHLGLAFPTGRLTSRAARWFIAAAWAYVVIFGTGALLFYDPASHGCTSCPADLNLFLVHEPSGALEQFRQLSFRLRQLPLPLVVVLTLLVLIVRRWWRASPPARRILNPVYLPATLFVSAFVLQDLARTGFGLHGFYAGHPNVDLLVRNVALFAGIAVPLGFVLGLARAQGRTARVGELVVELGALPSLDRLEASLARTLRDPSLSVGRWQPAEHRYVTARGSTLEMPPANADRSVTFLERDGTPLAAIVHDPALLDNPGLLHAVNAATRLAVDNERLQAELRTQLDETRASRIRIVAAADEARRRLERDLHDGVQQRLVILAMDVRLVEVGLSDPSARAAVAAIGDQMANALKELRDFARGVHPAVLTEEGLAPALKSLAERSPVPARLLETPKERLPPAHEAAAYFVVSEALANVGKHAKAAHVTVAARRSHDQLEIAITDDGIGGADTNSGSGIRGLSDRLAALDGTLEINSPPGLGTTLRATIPLPVGARGEAGATAREQS